VKKMATIYYRWALNCGGCDASKDLKVGIGYLVFMSKAGKTIAIDKNVERRERET